MSNETVDDKEVGRQRWLGVEFRHVAALAAVADEGTFNAAASRLGYVQSAVSQQIAALERVVGVRLIERTRGRRGVALTSAGEQLLRHFDEILARLAVAWADLEALDERCARVVRVGLPPGVESHVVPRVLPRLARETGVSVRMVDCADADAGAALADGRVDVALVSATPADRGLVSHRLLEDPLMLLVPPDSPLARRATAPSLDEIGAIALLGRRNSADAQTAFVALAARGIEPWIVYASDDYPTLHALVASGVGAAIVPALSVDWDGTVATVPLGGVLAPRVLSLVWHGDRHLTPAVETFCDATIAACRELQRELDERLSSVARLALAS